MKWPFGNDKARHRCESSSGLMTVHWTGKKAKPVRQHRKIALLCKTFHCTSCSSSFTSQKWQRGKTDKAALSSVSWRSLLVLWWASVFTWSNQISIEPITTGGSEDTGSGVERVPQRLHTHTVTYSRGTSYFPHYCNFHFNAFSYIYTVT